jgi:DNA-binding protein HU-beta
MADVKKKASKLTKAELVTMVAARTGWQKKDSMTALDTIIGEMQSAFTHGDTVAIKGFGTFTVKETKARNGRNPATGASIKIPAGRRVSFKPSKDLLG